MNRSRVSVFDPTGNITALVEGPVGDEAARVAAQVMARFPEVEQVGFVKLPEDEGAPVALRMAGDEFCGNASMSAAALYLLRRSAAPGEWEKVRLKVFGVSKELEIRLKRETEEGFYAEVPMPPVLSVREETLSLGALRGTLPVVRMEGISHAIVAPGSPFFALLNDRSGAEEAVRRLCGALGAESTGLMFLEGAAPRLRLTPLVYVRRCGTTFWETSCASGSAAAAAAFAASSGETVRLELSEPGGTLSVESAPRGGTRLFGRTRLVCEEILQS